jgi:hypothetical protein
LNIWKLVAVLSNAALLIIAVLYFTHSGEVIHSAETNRAFIVNVELEELKEQSILYAKIELPDDVFFYSKHQSEITKLRSITLAWDKIRDKVKLPFAIQANKQGLKSIQVFFYDENSNVVGQRSIRIRFKEKNHEVG